MSNIELHYESAPDTNVNLIIVIAFVYTLYMLRIYISLLHSF